MHTADRWELTELNPRMLPQMRQLETSSFSDPWSEELLHQELEADTSLCVGLCCGDRLAAAAYFRIAADEAELLRVAVLPEFRRRGLGMELLEEGKRLLVGRNCGELFLEVRESNAPARGLYQCLGFEIVGRRPGYYRAPEEDALLMRCALPLREPQAGDSF